MSNLMSTEEGRSALLIAQRWLLERRMSRFFKRNCAIEIDNYRNGEGFYLENLLGDLNTAHDNEILEIYRLLGSIGMLRETVADVTYYVNATTGSDTEGDGSASTPYASLWFLSNLPRKISHNIRIALQTDITDTDLDIVIDQTFTGVGSISFVGQGDPTVLSGPYTVSAVTDLYNSAATVVQATTPIGGAFEQNFLRVLSATDPSVVKRAVPIGSTPDVDKLMCRRLPLVNLQAGDTFDICVPAHKLEVRTINVVANGMSHYDLIEHRGARVAFINLKLAVYDDLDSQETIKIDATVGTIMSFCTIEPVSKMQINSDLNRNSSVDTYLTTLADCGVDNWVLDSFGTPNGCGVSSISSSSSGHNDIIIGKNANVNFIHTSDVIQVLRANVLLQYFGAGRLRGYYSHGQLAWGVIRGGAGDSAIDARYSELELSYCALIDTAFGIQVEGEAKLSVNLVGADPTYGSITNYGLWLNGIAPIVLESDPSALSGTLGDISFNAVSPAQTPAFPAAYGRATDSQGSIVKRLGV